jgi:hypothetical protein
MSNASVHNLAQEGKISEILAHLTENPSDINLKDAVSYFLFQFQTEACFNNIYRCDL